MGFTSSNENYRGIVCTEDLHLRIFVFYHIAVVQPGLIPSTSAETSTITGVEGSVQVRKYLQLCGIHHFYIYFCSP